MSTVELPIRFGRAEFWQEFEHNNRQCLVVVEMWRGRRWILIYFEQESRWIVSSRYAVCSPDGFLARIPQEYAERLYYGASVDGDGGYIVVEKGDSIWILLYDGDLDYLSLLDMIQIPCLDVVPYPMEQYLEFLLDSRVLNQLREELPVLANICEVYLIETVEEQIAYMVEDTGYLRRLFQYVWVGENWHLEGPFGAVDRDLWGDQRRVITDISAIYVGRTAQGMLKVVVEDGAYLRWWHTYIFSNNVWQLSKTHHVVLDDDEPDELERGIGESVVPDFVDDL
jgi:hypothetical protein